MLKKGELLWLGTEGGSEPYTEFVIQAHGYLWAFVGEVGEVNGSRAPNELWRVKSIATGKEEVFYCWRFRGAADEEGRDIRTAREVQGEAGGGARVH
jgi:hypothetical protein